MKLRYIIRGIILDLLSPILDPLEWLFLGIFGLIRKFVVWMALDVLGPRLWRKELQEFRRRSEKYFIEYEAEYLWEKVLIACSKYHDPISYPMYPFDVVIDELCRSRIMWSRANRFFEARSIRAEARSEKRWRNMFKGELTHVSWAPSDAYIAQRRMDGSIGYYERLVLASALAEYEQASDFMAKFGYEVSPFPKGYCDIFGGCKGYTGVFAEPFDASEKVLLDVEWCFSSVTEMVAYARLWAYGPKTTYYFTKRQQFKRFLRKSRFGKFLRARCVGRRKGFWLWLNCKILF